MRGCGNKALFGAAVLAAALVSPVYSASDLSTEERLDRIERQLEGRGLIDLLNQLEKLQSDVQQLHGDIEVQVHQLEDMQRRQRELYLDIDRRLQQLETGQSPGAAAMEPPVTTTAEPPVPAPPAPEVSPPPAPVAAPVSAPAAAPVTTAEEQADYEKALAILRQGRYADAATAFNLFLASYPGSGYTDNAYYWLGETYYTRNKYLEAASAFAEGYKRYPKSAKAPDNLLKLGMALGRANQKQNACIALAQLDRDFPHPGASIRERAAAEKKHLGC